MALKLVYLGFTLAVVVNGHKIPLKTIPTSKGLVVERGALANGPYFFMVRKVGTVVGAGKLVVQD